MIPAFDKYAPYVWWCYGITAVVLAVLLLVIVRRAARTRRELEALDGQRRRAPAATPAGERAT